MSDIIIEEDCPYCESKNFVNDGDAEDYTLPDCEAINCWNCDATFLTPLGLELVHYNMKMPKDCFAQDGKEELI